MPSYNTFTAAQALQVYNNLDIDETGQAVKTTPGVLYGYYIYNAAATVRYVKFYDKASAATVGTDTPAFVLPVPATAGANVSFTGGIGFNTGISVGAVTGVANSSTGAPSANDVQIVLFYR